MTFTVDRSPKTLRRVVVAVDFSPSSIAATTWVSRVFGPASEIVLVHAVEVPELPRFLHGRFPNREVLTATAREGAEARLRSMAAALPAARASALVRVGSPAEQLAAAAREVVADLVVVGKHGERSGLWERMGSTASRLLRLSPANVLLATGLRERNPIRILVALDDASITPLVVAWVRTLADRFGAQVAALHVISSAVLSHVLSMEAVTTGQTTFSPGETQKQFCEDADRWMATLLAGGIDRSHITSEVAFGEPAMEIVAAAVRFDSDLIVVGRSGGGGVRRRLLGSVVVDVLRRAHCPVLVVIEPEDEIENDMDPDVLAAAPTR